MSNHSTGLVAHRLGRSFLGIEINPAYAQLARERIRNDAPLMAQEVAWWETQPTNSPPPSAPGLRAGSAQAPEQAGEGEVKS